MHEPDPQIEQPELAQRQRPPVVPAYEATPVVPAYEAAPVVVAPYNVRAVQVTWFLVGLISTLIALRFVLKALGASAQAQFVAFIYGVTGPLVAPFHGIFPNSASGYYVIEPSSIIAIAIYLLLGWAIVTVIRITTAPKGTRKLY